MKYPLMRNNILREDLDAVIEHLKKEDPSKYYDIIERIGVGGFAKVFKVKRKIDNVICALKFVEPKN
jgi:serine/threonine protein kinase